MTSFKLRNENECEFEFWAPKRNKIKIVPAVGEAVDLYESTPKMFAGYLKINKWPFEYSVNVGEEKLYPDPKSTFLPRGVHGPSQLEHDSFVWTDHPWRGIPKSDLIIYELHVGTFSKAGTFAGCLQQLDYLQQLGVTAIELLPLAQCPGKWNWGYDGVGLWAVNCNYGRPRDLKRLVNECHDRGISVIHDVVYNHVGPEGNYLGVYGNYFSRKHRTPWGNAFDFDGPNQRHARQFVIENAIYWLDEFHFDGLRLDAIHYMFDDSDYPIQQEICDRIREYETNTNRQIHLIGEANIYDHDLIIASEPSANTYSAIWADDLMHAIYSVGNVGEHLTPRSYLGAGDVDEALNHGYLYQGPVMKRADASQRKATHGDAFELNRTYIESLIVALQTHDSVGNHPQGKRIHQLLSIEFQKAAAPLILLYPSIPMLFMGEEFAANSPFMFFADFIDQRLRRSVDTGRKKEFPHHDWSNSTKPSDASAFYDCKLELPAPDQPMLHWYKRLIQIRKQWKQNEWISANQMQVQCDQTKNLFCIRYERAGHCSFIVSRLTGKLADQLPVELSLDDGEVILDSKICCGENMPGQSPNRIQIHANQAIIGTGYIEI